MNVDMWDALLWGAVGGAAWTIPSWVRSTLRDRRRQREWERRNADAYTYRWVALVRRRPAEEEGR